MKCRINRFTTGFDNLREAWIKVFIDRRHLADLPNTDKPLTVEITTEKKKRSLSANAYCWVVCEEIAKVLGLSKEQVYRQAVSQVGVGQTYTMLEEAVERFKTVWESHGIGFQVIAMPPHNGKCDVIAYVGSSMYTREEMGRLLDWMVQEATDLGLDVRTPAERSLMLEEWEMV